MTVPHRCPGAWSLMNSAMWSLLRKCQCSSLSLRHHHLVSDTKVTGSWLCSSRTRSPQESCIKLKWKCTLPTCWCSLLFHWPCSSPCSKCCCSSYSSSTWFAGKRSEAGSSPGKAESSGKEAWSSCNQVGTDAWPWCSEFPAPNLYQAVGCWPRWTISACDW